MWPQQRPEPVVRRHETLAEQRLLGNSSTFTAWTNSVFTFFYPHLVSLTNLLQVKIFFNPCTVRVKYLFSFSRGLQTVVKRTHPPIPTFGTPFYSCSGLFANSSRPGDLEDTRNIPLSLLWVKECNNGWDQFSPNHNTYPILNSPVSWHL